MAGDVQQPLREPIVVAQVLEVHLVENLVINGLREAICVGDYDRVRLDVRQSLVVRVVSSSKMTPSAQPAQI